ncbi:MAG TPA: DNA glycosylase [Clostridia bacterium]|nr:DNA glycosylase [Clostridia bacterium]
MKSKPLFYKDHMLLSDVNPYDINLKDTFECGQCFRWERIDDENTYLGIAHGKILRVEQDDNSIKLFCNKQDFLDIWYDYFDLGTDYNEIKEILRKDDIMNKAISSAPGIRILNQELFETTISFITSSNSNIKRITKNIKDLSMLLGEPIKEGYYAFPTIEAISTASICTINNCRAGFRCEYIHKSAGIIKNMSTDFNKSRFRDIGYQNAKKELMQLKGVGQKVADCIILFAGISSYAFPTDVWIKRIMENLYIKRTVNLDYVLKYGQEKFGNLAGYAQQYLFHYARSFSLKT